MKHKRPIESGELVSDSEHGRMCPECSRPLDRCTCRPAAQSPPRTDGVVRVSRQTKGRKGKGVTLVTGLPLGASDLKQLARELKQRCGSGGAVKHGAIEIQGDHRDVLVHELMARGWTVKRAGG